MKIEYDTALSDDELKSEKDSIGNAAATAASIPLSAVTVEMALSSSGRRLLAVSYDVKITYDIPSGDESNTIVDTLTDSSFSSVIEQSSSGTVTDFATKVETVTGAPTPVKVIGSSSMKTPTMSPTVPVSFAPIVSVFWSYLFIAGFIVHSL